MRALLTLVFVTANIAVAQPLPVQQIFGFDTDGFDQFGADLDLVGDRLAVGAPRQGLAVGAAYVFGFDPATARWVQEARLQITGIALQGGTVRLLAPPPDRPGEWLALVGAGGASILYRRDAGGAWRQEGGLLNPSTGTFESGGQGTGLAREADGAEYAAVANNDSLFVWRRPPGGGAWTLDTCVGGPTGRVFAGVSALWTSPAGRPSLAVLERPNARVAVLRRTGAGPPEGTRCGGTSSPAGGVGRGAWAVESRLLPSPAGADEVFGADLDVDVRGGIERIVVGAPDTPTGVPHDGSIYVFEHMSGGAWAQAARINVSDPSRRPPDYVSVSGGVIAAYGGPAYIYRRDLGAWPLALSFEVFGEYGASSDGAWALDGDRLATGRTDNADRGTNAGAVWVFTLPAAAVPAESAPSAVRPLSVSVAPTPFRSRTTVTVTLAEAGPVSVSVYDRLGRRVAVLHDGALAAGDHMLPLDGAGWPSGVYVVRASGGGAVASRTLTRVVP